jgi:hypothetical protein
MHLVNDGELDFGTPVAVIAAADNGTNALKHK